MPYSPWPPLCLTLRPSPLALPATVSRSGTRRSTVSTATPYRLDSRSSIRSACASPMHQSTSWRVSEFISIRSVGSSATSRARACDILSSSALDLAVIATGSSGSGTDHGCMSSGRDGSDSVSPASAVASLATAQMSPAAHCDGRMLLLAERRGERADALVGVVVGVAALGHPVTGNVHGRVRPQRAGEHPDQADPPHVRVGGGLHHLGEQRALRVAGQAADRLAVERGDRGQRVLAGRGERLGHDLEQLFQADPAAGRGGQHRVEAAERHRLLQVRDEHLGVDLLAGQVPVHEGLVLALLDDPLDELAAQLLHPVGVAAARDRARCGSRPSSRRNAGRAARSGRGACRRPRSPAGRAAPPTRRTRPGRRPAPRRSRLAGGRSW